MMVQIDESPAGKTGPISLDHAVERLRGRFSAVTGLETVPLDRALGRVLATDQHSALAIPAFDCSAMDGWAVHAADMGSGALPVGGRVAAGHPRLEPVRPGHTYRIFTGAPLPAGLDAVVMQEEATESEGGILLPIVAPGTNVRRAGESVALGDRALRAGTVLRPQHLGLAAALGLAELPVRQRLRVAVASTGDEVRDPGSPLPPGGLYDSNRAMLIALLTAAGCVVSDLGIVADRPGALVDTLSLAAAGHDLILTSGGVSVGEEDHVRAVLTSIGTVEFWRLAIKPGKPLLVGRIGDIPLLGLPGNPVAVMIGFLLIGREVVAALSGAAPPSARRYTLPAAFSLHKKAGRREFPRAIVTEAGTVRLHPSDSSGVLSSVTASDGLLDLPEAELDIRPGDPVSFLPFSEVLP